MDEQHPRPKSGDVMIWDVDPEQPNTYWVRKHGRGSATPLFEGPDAWAQARSAAERLAGHEGVIWRRHKDGHFEKINS